MRHDRAGRCAQVLIEQLRERVLNLEVVMSGRCSCSAPSGTGKTTITRQMVAERERLALSVSTTTRAIRPGEIDGTHYRFVSVDAFQRAIAEGRFLEWAEVHGNFYGSDAQWVDAQLRSGRDLLFDIDVQGGHQIRAARPEATLILIIPPSWDELERRLRSRRTDSDEVIERRLMAAHQELVDAADYDVIVVNDRLDDALGDVRRVLDGEHDDAAARKLLGRLVAARAPKK